MNKTAYIQGIQYAFSKIAELSNPFPARLPDRPLKKQELMAALRQAIVSEHDAIAQYELQAEAAQDPVISKVLRSIADEERVHVGELTKLLEYLDGQESVLLEKGYDEASQWL